MKTSFNLLYCNSYFLYLITYTITFPICNTPFSFVICLNPTLNETLTMNVRSVFSLIFGLINQIGTKLHHFCKLVAVKLNLIIIKKITGMIHVLCNAKWLRRWWGVIACYRPPAAWLATDRVQTELIYWVKYTTRFLLISHHLQMIVKLPSNVCHTYHSSMQWICILEVMVLSQA